MFFVNPTSDGVRRCSAICTLLSSALIVLHQTQPASAETVPLESFTLVTVFQESEGKCFEANPEAFAQQENCDYKEGQYWLSRPAADSSSFQLVTNIFPELCLQATRAEGTSLEAQGAAFLAPCSEEPGQKWLFVDGGIPNFLLLKNHAGGADYCLEGNRMGPDSVLDGVSFLDSCQNVSGQFWRVIGAEVVNGIPYPIETEENYSEEARPVDGAHPGAAPEVVPAIAPDASSDQAPAESVVVDALGAVIEDVSPFDPTNDFAVAEVTPEPAARAIMESALEPGPAVPALTALQSCSINDAVCAPGVVRGYYMAAAPDSSGFILPLEADAPKPQLVVEHYPQDKGLVAVAFRDTQGRYLVINPNNGFTASFTAPSAVDENTRFLVVSALDSPEQGFASFVPLLYPGKYLRHSGFVLFAHDSDNSSLFNRDSSWRIVGLE